MSMGRDIAGRIRDLATRIERDLPGRQAPPQAAALADHLRDMAERSTLIDVRQTVRLRALAKAWSIRATGQPFLPFHQPDLVWMAQELRQIAVELDRAAVCAGLVQLKAPGGDAA